MINAHVVQNVGELTCKLIKIKDLSISKMYTFFCIFYGPDELQLNSTEWFTADFSKNNNNNSKIQLVSQWNVLEST